MSDKSVLKSIEKSMLIAHKRFLNYQEFAAYANLSEQYVRNLIHAGKLPTVRLWENGNRFIDMKAIIKRIETK